METMVRARSLNGYFQVVRRLGFNPQEALRQVGLDPAKLADTEQLVPVVAICQLMELTAASVSAWSSPSDSSLSASSFLSAASATFFL